MKTGNLSVSIDRVQPNTWNPNKMTPEFYKKLKRGIKKTLEEAGRIPPIVVRPNRSRKCYEIIDGEHRWKILKEMKLDKISVTSLNLDDKSAIILTNTLNYLRGEPDGEKFSKNIVDLLEQGASVADLEELLPLNHEELDTIIEASKLSVEAYNSVFDSNENNPPMGGTPDGNGIDDDDSTWVDIKFHISIGQAKVVEAEIARISNNLKGKKARARALEMMAVNSSHAELPEV